MESIIYMDQCTLNEYQFSTFARLSNSIAAKLLRRSSTSSIYVLDL